jgi:hypothetical protein
MVVGGRDLISVHSSCVCSLFWWNWKNEKQNWGGLLVQLMGSIYCWAEYEQCYTYGQFFTEITYGLITYTAGRVVVSDF